MGDTSLASMILDRAARYGSRRVFLRKRDSSWEDISWQQFGDQIVRAARGLAALGFQPGDRLAILADNRPEWPLLDLACLYLGGVDVPLYLTSPPDDLAYILNDAGASVLAVAGDDQRQKNCPDCLRAAEPRAAYPSRHGFRAGGRLAEPSRRAQPHRPAGQWRA
jgi:long-chain acyl-CoA synthetase